MRSLVPFRMFVSICLLVTSLTCFLACSPKIECTPPEVLQNNLCVLPEKKSEPTSEPSSEPKPEPRQEPTAEPNPEPMPEPDAGQEQVPEPSPEPQPEPKPEPSPEPTPEPQPEPRPEPRPEPTGPPPTVSITKPKDNDIVKDSVVIEVDASIGGTGSLRRVELYVDDVLKDRDTSAPWEFVLDTTKLTDAKHKIKVVAVTDGGKSSMAEITLLVSNNGPTIAFVKPAPSQAFTAKFDVEVTIKDTLGVKPGSVTLTIDGTPLKWTSTSPYKATFDPGKLGFESFPIEVVAENTAGQKSRKAVWFVHDPSPGPKKLGEECDLQDKTKRCTSGLSCLNLDGKKSKCYLNCVVNGSKKCPAAFSQKVECRQSLMETTRGVCVEVTSAPGSLYTQCNTPKQQGCNSGLTCVGATRPGQQSKYFCLKNCTTAADCGGNSFFCAPLSSGGGACLEKCGQPCKANSDCGSGQTCTGGSCSAPYCSNYGTCTSLTGLAFRVCI